nr:reverse transcriptase domain-containing protein [Tanacetum cinerariifolium]
MPLSVWERLSLPEHTPTCMTIELADHLVSKPIGIAKDVSFKVGVFHFPIDFVVVDFEPDPRVPLILGRCFLKTNRALIDVHKGELTLRIENEAITYNLDQTMRYSTNYNQKTTNKIDVIESACEEYSHEVLCFSDVTAKGTPTPQNDPIIFATSPTLTPFGDSDFLLFEEADTFLSLEDDPDSPKVNPFYYDSKGDILFKEAILNSEPSPPFPNQEQNMPSFKEELKAYEVQTVKSFVDEPQEGINPEFCTHKILMEEDYKLAVHNQRRVNPKIHDVIQKEVEKLLDAGLIYQISYSPWVSPLNKATRKDHFLLPFMDQMLERLAGNGYYCFLDDFSRYMKAILTMVMNVRNESRLSADIESFSLSPIPNLDSDSHMEEIDLYLNPDDPMPPGIEEDDDDSERDISILDKLLDNYSLSLPTNESYHFDIPSPYRPPAKPPDGNTGTLNIKMMGDVSDQKVSTITRILNQEKSPGLFSHLGFEAFQPSAECPMMINGKNTRVSDVPLFHFYPP